MLHKYYGFTIRLYTFWEFLWGGGEQRFIQKAEREKGGQRQNSHPLIDSADACCTGGQARAKVTPHLPGHQCHLLLPPGLCIARKLESDAAARHWTQALWCWLPWCLNCYTNCLLFFSTHSFLSSLEHGVHIVLFLTTCLQFTASRIVSEEQIGTE